MSLEPLKIVKIAAGDFALATGPGHPLGDVRGTDENTLLENITILFSAKVAAGDSALTCNTTLLVERRNNNHVEIRFRPAA